MAKVTLPAQSIGALTGASSRSFSARYPHTVAKRPIGTETRKIRRQYNGCEEATEQESDEGAADGGALIDPEGEAPSRSGGKASVSTRLSWP